jgi:hypothetical protein
MEANAYESLRDSVFGSFVVFDKLMASKAGYSDLELSDLVEEVIFHCFSCLPSDLKKKKILDKVRRKIDQPFMTVEYAGREDEPYGNQRSFMVKSNSVSLS